MLGCCFKLASFSREEAEYRVRAMNTIGSYLRLGDRRCSLDNHKRRSDGRPRGLRIQCTIGDIARDPEPLLVGGGEQIGVMKIVEC